jgi:hypothetical protein
MYLILGFLFVPSIVALGVQFSCYNKYLVKSTIFCHTCSGLAVDEEIACMGKA